MYFGEGKCLEPNAIWLDLNSGEFGEISLLTEILLGQLIKMAGPCWGVC